MPKPIVKKSLGQGASSKKPFHISYEELKNQLGLTKHKSESTENHHSGGVVTRRADGLFEVSAGTISSSQLLIAEQLKRQNEEYEKPKHANVSKPIVSQTVKKNARRGSFVYQKAQVSRKLLFPINGKGWVVNGMNTLHASNKIIEAGIHSYFGTKLPQVISESWLPAGKLFALIKNLEAHGVNQKRLNLVYSPFIEIAASTGFDAASRALRIFYISIAITSLERKGVAQSKLRREFVRNYGSISAPIKVLARNWPAIQAEIGIRPPFQALMSELDKRLKKTKK